MAAFDLQKALHKKGEQESARLDDFAFRLRVRTMHELAADIGEPADALVKLAVALDDAALAAALPPAATPERLAAARARAERALIAERGDPSPHRLA
jgi:hypothetical protein